ncbi:MAG: hypothetical protein KKD77_24210, partial [Gammaproteobacteria bacterium]|nr:hypothetical protein [Gammaproteobacteria bacterium]
MSLNVGKVCDLMELYAGQAGVAKDRLNRVLLREIINIKLRDFCRRTGILSSKWTISSVASQQEYQLPSDCIHVTKCNFDSYEAFKTMFEEVDEM